MPPAVAVGAHPVLCCDSQAVAVFPKGAGGQAEGGGVLNTFRESVKHAAVNMPLYSTRLATCPMHTLDTVHRAERVAPPAGCGTRGGAARAAE